MRSVDSLQPFLEMAGACSPGPAEPGRSEELARWGTAGRGVGCGMEFKSWVALSPPAADPERWLHHSREARFGDV